MHHQRIHKAICFDIVPHGGRRIELWLPLIPAGQFSGRDGRSWNNSNPDGVVAQFDMKLPFDVEHATRNSRKQHRGGWLDCRAAKTAPEKSGGVEVEWFRQRIAGREVRLLFARVRLLQ